MHNIIPQSTFLIELMIAIHAQSLCFIINEVREHQFCCSLKRLMFIIYIDALYFTFATERVVMIWLLVFVNYASLLHSIWSERELHASNMWMGIIFIFAFAVPNFALIFSPYIILLPLDNTWDMFYRTCFRHILHLCFVNCK